MEIRPLRLTFLYWVEAILAARVLLFTIPILLQKNIDPEASVFDFSDIFIVALTMISALYLAVGLGSLLGFRMGRYGHYLAAAITFLISGGLFRKMVALGVPFKIGYFAPLVLSVLAVFIIITQRNAKPAGA